MFGEIALIALALLNQCGLIAADRNPEVFLGQFFSAGAVQGAQPGAGGGKELFEQSGEEKYMLAPLPWRVKDEGLAIDAKSVLAMDNGTDTVLYEKNPHDKRPIASLTKIMTALVVLENSALDETVTISPQAMTMFGDKKDLAAGEQIRLGDLFKVMWIDSNNTAAYALAQHAGGGSMEKFVGLMNEKAQKLGLQDTHFYNPTGLDGGQDNYSTAYDLAQLTQYALSKPLLWEVSRMPEATVTSLDGKQKHYVQNTDELLGLMDNIYGGKTGYTTDAGQCLVLVSESPDKAHKVISVVLDAKDRFAETKRLVEWVFGNFRW
jgi:D-alanyl-D-alanine carboxypeptidase